MFSCIFSGSYPIPTYHVSGLTVGIIKVVSIESSYSSPEQEYTPISCQLILGLCFLKETMFKVFSLIIVISQFSLHQYIVWCVGLFCSTCHNLGRHSSPFLLVRESWQFVPQKCESCVINHTWNILGKCLAAVSTPSHHARWKFDLWIIFSNSDTGA